MAYFDKSYHPPGTPPGTLVEHGAAAPGALSIRLIDYTDQEYLDQTVTHADDCRPYLERDSITWIHFQGPIRADALRNIGELFDLHPLAMEDVMNSGQRPKVDEFEEQLFVVLAMPGGLLRDTGIDQVSVFMGPNYLISFHNGARDPFDPLRKRLQKRSGRIRTLGADYLLYGILDLVIDHGFPVLEGLGERIETLEDELLDAPVRSTLGEIHRLRRELLVMRRMLWPHRDVVNYLQRGDNALIGSGTLIYLRDCYDHAVQIIDLLENYRDMATSMLDVYLSSASHRLNEVMRVLTVIATIFIPLTFVAGVYGMNFEHPDSPWAMPELGWYYGYPMVLGLMLLIVAGMLLYFKRKGWF